MSTFCVICAKEADQGYLDAECFSRLASMLRRIEDETAILDAQPSMAQRTGVGGGSLASERSPAVLDAIVALDPRRGTGRIAYDDADPWGIDDTASVLETLHSRARTVREESGEDGPHTITVSGEREFLAQQLAWCARQSWIDEMFFEMRDLLGQLQRTNKTQDDRPEGICFLPRFDSTCGGRIWRRAQQRFVWRIKGDRCVREKVEIADGPAYCERCRAEWDGEALDRLHLIEEQRQAEAARPCTDDGRRMLTAQELVDAGIVSSVSNARVIAHRRGAVSLNGHYDPEDFRERISA